MRGRNIFGAIVEKRRDASETTSQISKTSKKYRRIVSYDPEMVPEEVLQEVE